LTFGDWDSILLKRFTNVRRRSPKANCLVSLLRCVGLRFLFHPTLPRVEREVRPGSLAELETQFELAIRLGYADSAVHPVISLSDQVGRQSLIPNPQSLDDGFHHRRRQLPCFTS
jgi:hypothetical protein